MNRLKEVGRNMITSLIKGHMTPSDIEDEDMGSIGFRGGSRCPHVVLQKISISTNELVDMPAGLRPRGWFIMFPNQKHPSIVCNDCGEISALQGNHKIDKRGIISPSVVCPNEDAKCQFHVFARLEDWSPEEALSEQMLRSLSKSSEGLVREMAGEILHLRRELKENSADEFREMVILACLGYNLGGEICKTLHIPVATVKLWALGRSRPLGHDEDRIYRAIAKLVSDRMKLSSNSPR